MQQCYIRAYVQPSEVKIELSIKRNMEGGGREEDAERERDASIGCALLHQRFMSLRVDAGLPFKTGKKCHNIRTRTRARA